MMCCLHCYTLLFFSEENLDFIQVSKFTKDELVSKLSSFKRHGNSELVKAIWYINNDGQ